MVGLGSLATARFWNPNAEISVLGQVSFEMSFSNLVEVIFTTFIRGSWPNVIDF